MIGLSCPKGFLRLTTTTTVPMTHIQIALYVVLLCEYFVVVGENSPSFCAYYTATAVVFMTRIRIALRCCFVHSSAFAIRKRAA